jgi:phage-related protein
MTWKVEYYSDKIQQDIMNLPEGLQARYIHLTKRMLIYGPNLREPHTKAMGNSLFELRVKRESHVFFTAPSSVPAL